LLDLRDAAASLRWWMQHFSPKLQFLLLAMHVIFNGSSNGDDHEHLHEEDALGTVSMAGQEHVTLAL